MRAALSVARLELSERRLLLIAAPVLGILPLLLRVLEGLWSADTPFALVYGTILSMAFPVAMAIAAGASLLARDAGEGRLGFYFSRPISAGALWSGKLLAAVALLLAALVGTSLPTMLVSQWLRKGPPMALQMWPLWLALGLPLLLMGVSHALAFASRVRSWWLGLDVAVGSLLLLASWGLFEGLLLEGAGPALTRALPWLLAGAGIAPLAAVAALLGHGGADLRRGRGAHSAGLWLALGLVVAGLWGFGAWLRQTRPPDVGVGSATAAPTGPGVVLTSAPGFARAGFAPAFLIDAETGSWTRISTERLSPVAFSPDGRRVAWVATGRRLRSRLVSEIVPGMKGTERMPILVDWMGNGLAWHGDPGGALLVARFGGGPPRVQEVDLDTDDAWSAVLALDEGGVRAALASSRALGVVDTATGRVSHRLSLEPRAAAFLPSGDLRVYAWEGSTVAGALVVLDWSPGEERPVERARVPGGPLIALEIAGDTALAQMVGDGTGELPQLLVDLEDGSAHRIPPGRSRLLSSGDVALAADGRLQILDRAGTVRAEWPLEGRALRLVEWQPGELAVGVWDPRRNGERTEIVDLATGRALRSEPGLVPVAPRSVPVFPPPVPPPPGALPRPGSPGARLFRTSLGGLIALEADGTRRALVADPE